MVETPPRKSRRRKLLWLAAILAPLLSCGGINAWNHARLDLNYRRALEEHLRLHPADAEAWYALATCTHVAGQERHFHAPNVEILGKAIALDPRALYLLTDLEGRGYVQKPERDAALIRLPEIAGERAALWMVIAGLRLEDGRLDDALVALRKALACPAMGYFRGEAIDLHRRFIRRFFGDGYAADSLILRHEAVDGVFHFVSRPLALVEEEVGRLWMSGDLEGAKAALASLYKLGEESRERDMKWRAARGLCELALERGAPDAEAWKSRADPFRPKSRIVSCGNVFYQDDPWIVESTWPVRNHYFWTLPSTWLPLWYRFQRARFHGIAEGLGDPEFPAWRRASRELEEKYPADPSPLDGLFKHRELLYRPVGDQAAFDRLAALASGCDAAVLALLRSRWTSTSPPSGPLTSAVAYLQAKKGAYETAEEPERRRIAQLLAEVDSPLWGPDAWRMSAKIHRDAYLDQTLKKLSWYWRPGRLAVLQEVTGQSFGFDSGAWGQWLFWQRRAKPK
ncbi:MAG TPA: hypothetical protein VF950_27595 [Planctomycetota bacterium]